MCADDVLVRYSVLFFAEALLLKPVDDVTYNNDAPRDHCACRCGSTNQGKQASALIASATSESRNLNWLEFHLLGSNSTAGVVDFGRYRYEHTALNQEHE